ncbi:MAG: hypothetical protein M0R06_06940 [Sphaerochaeta sp.]|jgi:hypothetical protein|nr:hypothetical protein [Sphaerochaeta sp.]
MSVKNDLFWLAGFTEADGSICLHRFKRGDTGHDRIACTIVLTNCDPNLINEIDRITRRFIGIKMYLLERRRPESKADVWATNWQMTVTSYADCYKFLKATVPYMRGTKRAIGCLMMRFIESRKMKSETCPNNQMPYSDRERNLYVKAKSLQERGKDKKLLNRSETKDDALYTSDDIVRTRDESARGK